MLIYNVNKYKTQKQSDFRTVEESDVSGFFIPSNSSI